MRVKIIDALPCPFCGGNDLYIEDEEENILIRSNWVVCNNVNCNAEGPFDLGVSGAIDKWNTRAKLGEQDD